MARKPYSRINDIRSGTASDVITKGCLVLEGGAFRGLYSQGAMDALMENDINFECIIGVSAGALGGMNYASGQIGRSARVNLGYRFDSDYIGLKSLLHAHSPIRLDFCLYDYQEIEPFDKERFYSPDRRFVAVATNCKTGEAEFFEKGKCRDIFRAVKASASMPYISQMVNVDGKQCLDGGCSCKIPYKWAMDEGYQKIVVIRTREKDFRKEVKEHHSVLDPYRKFPEFYKKLISSDEEYNKTCIEMEELEKEGKLFVLYPSTKVTVSRVDKDIEKLGALYWQGYNDCLDRMDELKKYLEN